MSLRRLFSTFAQGWPGAGLLILRLVAGCAMIACGLRELKVAGSAESAIPEIAAIVVGGLMLVGLWTPISGCLAAAFALWTVVTKPTDPWIGILLAAVGVALSMIGPGMWSLDARLFGWRRIVVRDPEE